MTGDKYILRRPVISEKSLEKAAKGFYTFEVSLRATKPEIKKEVEREWKVNVISVKTHIKKGVGVRTGKRKIKSISKPQKLAVVQIKPDQKIDLFEVTK